MSKILEDALSEIDWGKNVSDFCSNADVLQRLHASIAKVAIAAQQIQIVDKGNPALPFVQEMQLAANDVARCVALSLYKPAAAGMRSMLECALYYSYFRSHPLELKTLIRDKKYYVSKSEIILFFQAHVASWSKKQSSVGLISRLDAWYSEVSAIVHGQIPGQWRDLSAINEPAHDVELLREVVSFCSDCGDIVRDLFICSFLDESWQFVETDAKRELLKGVSADYRQKLKLDRA